MEIAGKYEITLDTPMGSQGATFELIPRGTALSGKILSMMGSVDIDEIVVDGNDLTWNVSAQTPMGEMEMRGRATVDGEKISGEVSIGPLGSAAFTGTRTGQ
jgi:hypothetical protein